MVPSSITHIQELEVDIYYRLYVYIGIWIGVLMNNQERRKILIDFITHHHGCTREDIIKSKDIPISRNTVFKLVAELKDDGILDETLEKENSRDHKLFVRSDNLLISISRELEEFEKAYVKLLYASKERFKKKDFSAIAKKLGIHECDPSKWDESEKFRYFTFEEEKMREFLQKTHLSVDEMSKRKKELEHDMNNFGGQVLDSIQESRKISSNDSSPPSYDTTKAISGMKRYLPQLTKLKSEALELLSSISEIDIDNFEISALVLGSINIFYLMTDIIFYRSTLVWPSTVHDRQTLQKLYTIVYTKIAEIHTELTKFITFTKFSPYSRPTNPIKFIMENRIIRSYEYQAVASYMTYYRTLNMQAELESVIAALSRLGKEIEQYGYRIRIDYFRGLVADLEGIISAINNAVLAVPDL